MKKLLSSDFIKTAVKFCGTGGLCTGLDLVLYFLLCKAGVTAEIAKVISTTTACVLGFFLNRAWTFLYKGKNHWGLPAKYAVAQVANICANTGMNKLALSLTNRNMLLSFIAATACGMVVNFTLQKFWVFKEKKA